MANPSFFGVLFVLRDIGSRIPVGFVPNPLPTVPVCLRSMCQLSVSPALFFSVKAKTALPCLMASFLSASLAVRAELMASKAAEDGNLSGEEGGLLDACACDDATGWNGTLVHTVLETHFGGCLKY